MKSLLSENIVSILFTTVLCYAWCVLVLFNGDLLYTVQDFSPWLGTRDFLMQYAGHPGGLREWVGEWLTQLFYYPWLGGSIMALMWAITSVSLTKACRLKQGFQLLALLPVLALLTGITQLGYWLFCLKTVSYWFGPTVGAFCIGLYAWGYSRVGFVSRCILLAMWSIFGIPLLGWFGTLGLIVLLLLSSKIYPSSLPDGKSLSFSQWGWLLTPSIIALIAILGYYSKSASVQWQQPLWWYGFPHVVIPEASSKLLEVAPWMMVVSFIALPLIARVQRFSCVQRLALPLSVLLLAMGLYGANMLHYRNKNFHSELIMLRAMDEGRWEDLLQEMKDLDRKPTREMLLMKDVALAQKGRLADEAFLYDMRGVNPRMNIDLPIHMVHSAGPTVYYWLGMPNYSYMWAMENYIEYGVSPHWLRLFYRSSVVNGEVELAKKYKTLLQTTLFHKDLTVSDEEIRSIRELNCIDNELTNDGGFCESFLMSSLCKASYLSPKGMQIALHYALLMRKSELFVKGLDYYGSLVGRDKPLPVAYQEALLLFVVNQTQNDAESMSSLPVSEEVRKRFDVYRAAVSQTLTQPLSPENIGEQIYKRFGHTYWWYYDFYSNNKTY